MIINNTKDIFDDSNPTKWDVVDSDLRHKLKEIKKDLQKVSTAEDQDIVLGVLSEDKFPEIRMPLSFIRTNICTLILTPIEDSKTRIFGVVISQKGNINSEQVNYLHKCIESKPDPKTNDKIELKRIKKALITLESTKDIVKRNCDEFEKIMGEMTYAIVENKPNQKISELYSKMKAELHNMLASVWSMRENTKNVLKDVEILKTNTEVTQEYRDNLRAEIGLRHAIQHNIVFDIEWNLTYEYSSNTMSVEYYIPLRKINDDRYYTDGSVSDSNGNKYKSPTDYFYEDINNRVYLQKASNRISKHTEDMYYDVCAIIRDEKPNILPDIENLYALNLVNNKRIKSIRIDNI